MSRIALLTLKGRNEDKVRFSAEHVRIRQMTALSRHLAKLTEALELPDHVSLSVDIDPVNLL